MKVYHSRSFWEHQEDTEQALEEIILNKKFVWEELTGFIPAVYTGPEGVVMDLCFCIPRAQIHNFLNKWKEKTENETLSGEEEEEIRRENPFHIDVTLDVAVNGIMLQKSSSCGCCYNPVIEEEELPIEGQIEEEAKTLEESLADDYGCDKSQGWYFMRAAFDWVGTEVSYEEASDGIMRENRVLGKEIEDIRSLSVTFHSEKVPVSGEAFVADAGKKIMLRNPATNETVIITIHECENAVLPRETFFHMHDIEYPRYYQVCSYSMEPELEQDVFYIQDCAGSDTPRTVVDDRLQVEAGRENVQENGPEVEGAEDNIDNMEAKEVCDGERPKRKSACGISVIGGADGPTSIFIAGKCKEPGKHTVCSALHFAPVSQVLWKPVFLITKRQDMVLEIDK